MEIKVNYKDVILKNKDIMWKHPKIKYIEDGKVDMILTIPLTSILEKQAYIAFAAGAKAVFDFFRDNQDKSLREIAELLEPRLDEWGLSTRNK